MPFSKSQKTEPLFHSIIIDIITLNIEGNGASDFTKRLTKGMAKKYIYDKKKGQQTQSDFFYVMNPAVVLVRGSH